MDMRYSFIICLVFSIGCEYQGKGNVTYELISEDSLIYEISSLDCHLVIHQQRIKSNELSLIQVWIYNQDKSNLLTNANLNLTIISKGRRKSIQGINLTAPGVYEGRMEINFTGFSTLEFEVITPDFKNRELVDQEIKDN